MKTVSNEIIKQAILLKDGRTNKQIAMDLGVTSMRVSSNYSHLSNKGLVPKLGKVKVVKKTKKVKKVKVVVNTYNNTDGVKKQEARNIIEKAIIASKLFEKPILTLPFEECKLEMQLLKNVSENLRFLGCEMIDETYNKMLMTIASNNLPISTHKGKIGDIILEARENQFSNLILDYCGQFGTYQNDIKTAMENNIVEVNGSICITANKRIAVNTFGIYEQMERLNPQFGITEETRCVHAMLTFINRIGGFKYAIEKVFDYNDGRGKNMVLIIVRRIS